MPQSSQPVTLVGLDRVEELIAQGETLHCEFKSDKRRLSDDELVEAVVCLANTEGGVVLLGVEDDGTPTGINPKRKETTDAIGAMIFNKTDPAAFRAVLSKSGYYKEWKSTYGAEAWALLEKYTGPLG